MKILTTVVIMLCALSAEAADVLPAQCVGVWATEDSVFNGSALIGGTAIYLDSNGDGAIVGAPLPVQMCGERYCAPIIGVKIHATMDSDGSTIRASVSDYGDKKIDLKIAYDAVTRVLTMPSKNEKVQRLLRREAMLPDEIRSELNAIPSH